MPHQLSKYDEFNAIHDGQREMLVHAEENPFLQYLRQLYAALFQGCCIGAYPRTDGNFPVERTMVVLENSHMA